MDYYETQKKYRKKSLKIFINLFLKIMFVALSILIGWRIGASDKDILLLEICLTFFSGSSFVSLKILFSYFSKIPK